MLNNEDFKMPIMKDVQCPYCGSEEEINHDDGCGYEEDKIHSQTCGTCEKEYIYRTNISYSYETGQAPCLNGGEHDMVPVRHYPPIYSEWRRCTICEHEVGQNFVDYTKQTDGK